MEDKERRKKPRLMADGRVSLTNLNFNAVMDILARMLLRAFRANPAMTDDEAVGIALEYAEDIEIHNQEGRK